jgi:hypothetical protein
LNGAPDSRPFIADLRPNASSDRRRTKTKIAELDESHLVTKSHHHAVTSLAAAIFSRIYLLLKARAS